MNVPNITRRHPRSVKNSRIAKADNPPEVRALSWKAQNRLHSRFVRLAARRLMRNKIVVAIARELCAFIWALLRNQSCYLQSDEHPKQAASGPKSPHERGTTFPRNPSSKGNSKLALAYQIPN